MTAHSTRREIRISIVMSALTVTAGAVDAVTFLGLGHVLAALATGNLPWTRARTEHDLRIRAFIAGMRDGRR
jgi:uncharacterized membrane protein YoaK (UPF0700 family)